MDKKQIQEYYKFSNSRWVGPLYYNYPDGEDLKGKLGFCGQLGLFISTPFGLLSAYTIQPFPTTHIGRFVKVLSVVLPGIGTGLTFAATTYYSTNIRQKDDMINHIYGGLAAGTFLGVFRGLSTGIFASIFFAAFAGALKCTHSNGVEDKIRVRRNWSPYIRRAKNLQGYPDVGDNWVKAPRPEI